ncbi:MAG: hypothetical protein IPL41_04035 [Micropruina sp.]|nr:hypothetical protein [Micropruina sp.]
MDGRYVNVGRGDVGSGEIVGVVVGWVEVSVGDGSGSDVVLVGDGSGSDVVLVGDGSGSDVVLVGDGFGDRVGCGVRLGRGCSDHVGVGCGVRLGRGCSDHVCVGRGVRVRVGSGCGFSVVVEVGDVVGLGVHARRLSHGRGPPCAKAGAEANRAAKSITAAPQTATRSLRPSEMLIDPPVHTSSTDYSAHLPIVLPSRPESQRLVEGCRPRVS